MKQAVCAVLIGAAAALEGSLWKYDAQEKWPGVCTTGRKQSPIDISTHKVLQDHSLTKLVLDKNDDTIDGTAIVNPHTWEIDYTSDDAPIITWNSKEYVLQSFHYHSPSEHTIDGKHFDLEAHHVHKFTDANGNEELMVVAVMAKVGAENKYLKTFWDEAFPDKVGKQHEVDVASPYPAFLPSDLSYYQLDGSVTTPDCSEGVTWIILQNHLELGQEQLSHYRTAINSVKDNQLQIVPTKPAGVSKGWDSTLGTNNRDIQALNGRVIKAYKDEKSSLAGLIV